jgi:hypothetical protein
MRGYLKGMIFAAASIAMMPSAVLGQGAIGGLVRDANGGVLPGVTIEASSDALIEKTRTVVTDSGGEYLIVNLRPGIYAVTFSLQGFNSIRRTGLAVTAGVTLPVNVDLAVGSIEETVTVSGETPVVDVQNTQVQTVVARELLDSIPRIRNQGWTGSLLPGVTGGIGNPTPGFPIIFLNVHGSEGGDQIWAVDGFKLSEGNNGSSRMLIPTDLSVEEYTYETSGISAEIPSGGVRSNIVPKAGGNTFRGGFVGTYTSQGMVQDNLTSDLKAQGLSAALKVAKVYDISGGIGGPVAQDHAWFFASYRHYGTYSLIPGAFSDANPTAPFEDKPDFGDYNGRLTWQATPRNKLTLFLDTGSWDTKHNGLNAITSAEATTHFSSKKLFLSQGRWTSPVNNRLLLEAGAQFYYQTQCNCIAAESLPNAYSVFDVATGRLSGQRLPNQLEDTKAEWLTTSASLSYVTGSHAFKVGFSNLAGYWFKHSIDGFDRPALILNKGLPFQVQLFPRPAVSLPRLNRDLGIFAQDQWRVLQRLTLNLGLRFDYLNEQIDAQFAAAGNFVPARSSPEVNNVPNWKDISPRLGAVWDVFGAGKTAVKVSVSRYVRADQGSFADTVNPFSAATNAGNIDTRTWTNPNWNAALCSGTITTQSPAACQPQLSQLGPSTNRLFGQSALSTIPDPSITNGWGVRGYNWEYAASIQQQLLPGLALNVGYYRRSFGNLIWNHNRAVQFSNYTPFAFTSPLNGEIITRYNLDPALRGVTNNVLEFAPNDSRVFSGVDITVNGKFGRGGVATGGISLGRTALNRCTVSDPNLLRFCDVTSPLKADSTYKGIVSYPLPYDVKVSGVFQILPFKSGGGTVYNNGGPDLSSFSLLAANYTVTSAIAGQTLTNGSIPVNLAAPGSEIGDHQIRLDMRLSKTWKRGSLRLQPYLDLFNALNASNVLSRNETSGANWLKPTAIYPGRLAQVGVQIDF